MKHYVLMRLKPGVFDGEAEADYRETFEKLREALPEEILSVSVRRNTVDRPQNMTVMIEMTLKDQDSLKKYLSHSLQQIKPLLRNILIFIDENISVFPDPALMLSFLDLIKDLNRYSLSAIC